MDFRCEVEDSIATLKNQHTVTHNIELLHQQNLPAHSEKLAPLELKVTVCSALHLPKTDMIGKCDAFCELEWLGQKFRTQVVKNSFTPTWQETFTFPLSQLDKHSGVPDLKLVLKDWDRIADADVVGYCTISCNTLATALDPISSDSLNLTLPVTTDGGKAVLGAVSKEPCVLHVTVDCEFELTGPVETKGTTSPRRSSLALAGGTGKHRHTLRNGSFSSEKAADGLELAEEKMLDLDGSSHRAGELLGLLSSLHLAVPELPDAAPRLYRMGAGEYHRQRTRFIHTLLKTAQLTLHVMTYLHSLNHSTR